MTFPSPWPARTKSNPLSWVVGKTRDNWLEVEKCQLVLFVGGRLVWQSVTFPVGYEHPVIPAVHRRKGEKIALYLYFSTFRRGYPYTARTRLPHIVDDLKKSGRVRVKLPVVRTGSKRSSAVLPVAVQKVRNSVQPRDHPRSSRMGVQKSSPSRPNPEVQNTPCLHVTEFSNRDDTFTSVTNDSYELYRRTWSGIRTPGFAKLRKSQYPVNPHTVAITVVKSNVLDDSSFVTEHDSGQPGGALFQEFTKFTTQYSAPAVLAVPLSLARTKAIKSLTEKAEGDMAANIAQDCAQIGQTVALIANTAGRIHKSVASLRRGNIPGALSALASSHIPRVKGKGPSAAKTIAINWLELQYAWKPLLQDIDGAMRALAKLNHASDQVRRVTASGTSQDQTEAPIPFFHDGSKVAGKHTVFTETSCRYAMRYRIDSHLQSFLGQTGFTNPINLGWEILPFSFVVDWFIPIGPYLESLSSFAGMSFVDGSETMFTRESVNSAVNISTVSFGQFLLSGGSFQRDSILLSRTKLVSFPGQAFPSIFKNGLASTTHAANAIALMKSVFG